VETNWVMQSVKSLYQKNRLYYQKRLSLVLERLNWKNKRILDLGCGEMLLKNFIQGDEIVDYLGVDNIPYQHTPDFICMDVIQFLSEYKMDNELIFCLGLIDHLEVEAQNRLIELLSLKTFYRIIISKSNENNILFKNLNIGREINLPNCFVIIEKMYLLKIPFTSKIILLKYFGDIFATEIIYYLAKKVEPK